MKFYDLTRSPEVASDSVAAYAGRWTVLAMHRTLGSFVDELTYVTEAEALEQVAMLRWILRADPLVWLYPAQRVVFSKDITLVMAMPVGAA